MSMNALIENTLHIISKISYSRQGYLLQLNDYGYEVLNIWGSRSDDFIKLNNLLFKLFKAGGIDTEKFAELPSVPGLLKERFAASFFIKDLIFFSERNLFVYILLFSDYPDEFKEETRNRILPVLSILSHQLKTAFEQRPDQNLNQIEKKFDSQQSKKIFDEWEDKFNLLVNTSPDLIFILDSSGKFILVNDFVKNYFDYQPDEIKGKHFLDFIVKEDTSSVNLALNKVLIDKRSAKFTVNFLTKYGQVFPVELSCNAIYSKNKFIGLLGVGKDLIDKYRYETELQKLRPKLTEVDRLLKNKRAFSGIKRNSKPVIANNRAKTKLIVL